MPTASGARAVQIVHKQGLKSWGSSTSGPLLNAALALLMEIVSRLRLHDGQRVLELGLPSLSGSPARRVPGARVAGDVEAISRYLQDQTDMSIRKLVRTLRPLRSVTIEVDAHAITAEPTITAEAAEILNSLQRGD